MNIQIIDGSSPEAATARPIKVVSPPPAADLSATTDGSRSPNEVPACSTPSEPRNGVGAGLRLAPIRFTSAGPQSRVNRDPAVGRAGIGRSDWPAGNFEPLD